MAARIVYKALAQAEIEEAYAEYDSFRRGLGDELLDELARIEGHLQANPALYQTVDGDMRRAVLRRFPYGIFYVIDGAIVNVLGFLHLRRDPRSRTELQTR